MPEELIIRLAGEPKGKGRHRSRLVTPRGGRAPFVMQHPDPATAKYESHLRYAAQQVMVGRPLLSGQLRVVVYVFRAIPTSMPKWKQDLARDKILRPAVKPDWDNYGKICDALNKIVWTDDSLIVSGHVEKFYSEAPELVVSVEELPVPTRASKPAPALSLFAEAAE